MVEEEGTDEKEEGTGEKDIWMEVKEDVWLRMSSFSNLSTRHPGYNETYYLCI